MKRCIRMATYLGSPYMVVHPLMPFGENSPENPAKVIDLNVEHYMRLASYAKDHNVTVCLENMPFPELPLAHVDQIAEFVDGIGMKNLKVCLDTGHAAICGTPLYDAVRLLGDRLATLHVHDNHGEKDEHIVPYLGDIRWEYVLEALAEINYTGDLTLELPGFIPKYSPNMLPEALAFAAGVGQKMREQFLAMKG
jgi:sugar phosphate isomerase/epimerase